MITVNYTYISEKGHSLKGINKVCNSYYYYCQ